MINRFSFLWVDTGCVLPVFQLSLNKSRVHSSSKFNCVQSATTNCAPAIIPPEGPPAEPSHDAKDDVRQRSYCPWTLDWNVNEDNGRYPEMIAEARCLCPVDTHPRCACLHDKGDKTSACEPTVIYTPILVNTHMPDAHGTCVYRREMFPLKVGCACAKTS